MSGIMKTITSISTTALFGLFLIGKTHTHHSLPSTRVQICKEEHRETDMCLTISAEITSVNAQGQPFGTQNGWGYGGDNNNNNNNNPYDSNSNNDGSSNGGSSPGFGFGVDASNAGFDYASALRYRTAHGVLAAIAFAFLFPLGSIVMRVTPGPYVWILHGSIQLLAYGLYSGAAGLGLYLVSVARIPPSGTSLLDAAATNAHPIIGIVLLGVLFFQPLLGALHHRRFSKRGTRTWVSHAHLWIGRLGITLGIINGGLGLALAGAAGAPVVAYSVVAGVMWVLWLLATLFGEYRRARAPKKDKEMAHDERYVRGAGAGTGARAAASPTRNAAAGPVVGQDVPSPPYSPGPHYEAHLAHRHQQLYFGGGFYGIQNAKEVADRPDMLATLSPSQDEMYRGQV
jgi:hypothetical protein